MLVWQPYRTYSWATADGWSVSGRPGSLRGQRSRRWGGVAPSGGGSGRACLLARGLTLLRTYRTCGGPTKLLIASPCPLPSQTTWLRWGWCPRILMWLALAPTEVSETSWRHYSQASFQGPGEREGRLYKRARVCCGACFKLSCSSG